MNPHFHVRLRAPLAAVLACLLAAPTMTFWPRRLHATATTASRLATTPFVFNTALSDSTRPKPFRRLPASVSLFSPQVTTLRGIVVRATGQPCAGAVVYATQVPRQVVATDAHGAFTLAVPAGTAVVLRVEYFGEGSSRVAVPLPATGPLHITLGQ